MPEVDAIYESGVFRPLGKVRLKENQRVRLKITSIDVDEALKWLDEVKQRQQEFVARHGYLPDSTPDIREDRMRDA